MDARLVGDGNLIFTDYEIAVEEVIKGNHKDVTTIKVSFPGDRIYFEGGKMAEAFTLVGGPQGIVGARE